MPAESVKGIAEPVITYAVEGMKVRPGDGTGAAKGG